MKRLLILLLLAPIAATAATFLEDTFTAADGTLLTAHTSDSGHTWSAASAGGGTTASITPSGHLTFSGTYGYYVASGTSSGTAMTVTAVIDYTSGGTSGIQLLGRAGSTWGSNFAYGARLDFVTGLVYLRIEGSNASVIKQVAYTFTTGTTYTVELSLSDALKVIRINGVVVITSTNNTIAGASGQRAGWSAFGTNNSTAGFSTRSITAVDGAFTTVTAAPTGTTTITATSAAVTKGSATYDWQWQRAPDANGFPGAWADVGSAQLGIAKGTAPTALNDTGRAPNTYYWYRGQVTYEDDSTEYSETAFAKTYVSGSVFVQDTFKDDPQTLLTAHTGEVGATWTSLNSGSNVAKIAPTGRLSTLSSYAYYTASGTSSGEAVTVVAQVTPYPSGAPNNGGIALLARFGASWVTNSGYSAHFNTANNVVNIRLEGTNNSGAGTVLASAPYTFTGGVQHTVSFVVTDTVKMALVDGVVVVSTTNNTIVGASGQRVGVAFFSANSEAGGFVARYVTAFDGAPPSISASSNSTSGATVACSNITSGASPYSYQVQRAPDVDGAPGSWSDAGSPQTALTVGDAPAPYVDSGLSPDTLYWYRGFITFSDTATLATDPVRIRTWPHNPGSWYIAADGDDENSGTSASEPWQTIARVNAHGSVPGDTFHFKGGDTFSGNLLIEPPAQPGPASRITVTSYGSGRATISPGTGYGIKIVDCGYVTIEQLAIDGPGVTITGTYPNATGTTTSTAPGILYEITTNNTWRAGLVIDGNVIEGMAFGIVFRNPNEGTVAASAEHWRITNNEITGCGVEGILIHQGVIYGVYPATNQWRYGVISGNRIVDTWGITNWVFTGSDFRGPIDNPSQNGYPLFLTQLYQVEISNNLLLRSNYAAPQNAAGGGAGMVLCTSRNVTVRHNEVNTVYNPSGSDGVGLDLDVDCKDCVVEFNYITNTAGPGLLHFQSYQPGGGNVYRYNVIENCGWDNDPAGILDVGSTPATYHNNVFYITKTGSSPTKILEMGPSATKLYNNVFVARGGAAFGATKGTLIGNVYHVEDGSTFSLTVNGVAYTSLSNLQAAGFEMDNGLPAGAVGDPLFSDPGQGTRMLPERPISLLPGYDMAAGSPAFSAGIDLRRKGIALPPFDFYGNPSLTSQTGAGATVEGSQPREGGSRITATAF